MTQRQTCAKTRRAEGQENRKLLRCSASVNVDVEDLQYENIDAGGFPDTEEQPEDDHVCELPTLCHLVVQSYEGRTRKGLFHGEGVAYYEGGHMYKGMFSRGLMNGFGVFTWSNGVKYEGELVGNNLMGQGTYTWPDGSSYKGDVCNGMRHGTGYHVCAKGCVTYTGQWDRGKRHGKGTVYYNQDKTSWYKGDWVKNNREGCGVRCYASGNIYCGEWKNNRRHGQGTMRWLKLGQQYDGEWMDGAQHGRGTHVWILQRSNCCHYSQSNQYTGDFVQGQRHGQGTFSYAGGAVYEGEWKNNKKHGKSKFTLKDGRVFEGEFVDDQMMAPSVHRNGPLCGVFLLSDSESSTLDVALNIKCLLDKIPETKRNAEVKQIESVVLWQNTKLRSIYSFYAGLRNSHTFLLSRLQLWRLLKDCKIHHHGITLTQIDRLIKDDGTTEIHSPFTPMKFHKFISCLVTVAYHIYSNVVSAENLLATCLSKLLTDDILLNAKNVKGFLFGQPGQSVESMAYTKKCWEIYTFFCRVNATSTDDQTMTYQHLLWMFRDLQLLDNDLTLAKVLEIITAERQDSNNLSSCLDQEITFLEFFEVLLGCAKIKCQQLSEDLEECPSLSGFNTEEDGSGRTVKISHPIPPETPTPESVEMGKSNDTAENSIAHDVRSRENVSELQFEEHIGEEEKDVQTRRIKAEQRKLQLWSQTIGQFFNHVFFPAFEHHLSVTRYIKVQHHPDAQRRRRLQTSQQKARKQGLRRLMNDKM